MNYIYVIGLTHVEYNVLLSRVIEIYYGLIGTSSTHAVLNAIRH